MYMYLDILTKLLFFFFSFRIHDTMSAAGQRERASERAKKKKKLQVVFHTPQVLTWRID